MAVTTTVPLSARNTSPLSVTRPGTGPPSLSGAGPPSNSAGNATPKCCDTGRQIVDPFTGQPICSCQYEREAINNYQRLASGIGLTGPSGVPLYSGPYSDTMTAYFPALGTDPPSFYPNPVSKFNDFYAKISALRKNL